MGWIAQPLGTWTVFSAEGELCAGESVAAWEVGIPGMQRFNGRCSKGATVVCTNVEKRETSRLWSASAFAATQCSGEHDAHSHARTMQEGVVSLPQRVSSNPRPRRPRPHIQDPSTHLLLLVYSCCYLPNTLHIIRIASLPQAEMRTPAAPFVPEPVLFQSALPSLHVAWRRNRCQAQANHSFTVDRPLSTRACVSLLLVLSIFQISILACVISCV